MVTWQVQLWGSCFLYVTSTDNSSRIKTAKQDKLIDSPIMIVRCKHNTRARIGIACHPSAVYTEQHNEKHHNQYYDWLEIAWHLSISSTRGLGVSLLGWLGVSTTLCRLHLQITCMCGQCVLLCIGLTSTVILHLGCKICPLSSIYVHMNVANKPVCNNNGDEDSKATKRYFDFWPYVTILSLSIQYLRHIILCYWSSIKKDNNIYIYLLGVNRGQVYICSQI